MINRIYLQHFKCFLTVEVRPRQITAFVGANGTGKSSVLQAFGLLKQTVEAVKASRGLYALSTDCDLELNGPLVNFSDSNELSCEFSESDPDIYFAGTARIQGGFPFSHRAVISQGKLQPHEAIRGNADNLSHSVLSSLRIVPAVRGLTRSKYELAENYEGDVSLIEGFDKQGIQLASNLAYSEDSVGRVSSLVQRVTGVGLKSILVPLRSVEIKSVTKRESFNVVSEGFGTNSLIMLLLQLTSAEKGATVMIEEPEIHLHPKAQAELAEVLVEVALEEDKQVIMTTHSEHITGRLLTLVAEGKLTPDEVAIYAFEKDEEGVCTARELKISDDGRIEGSIGDFFEVNLAEMSRMVKALESRTNQGG